MSKLSLIIIPVSLMTFDVQALDYSLDVKKSKKGYMVRVLNHTNRSMHCYLKQKQTSNYVVVRPKRVSEPYFFKSVPEIICKKR